MAFIKRSYRLRVEVEKNYKVFQELRGDELGLKMEFSAINSVNSAQFCEGEVRIQNLARDDMYYLASCAQIAPNGEGVYRKNSVQLEVGYNGELAVVLAGNVIQVDADFASTDRMVNLKVMAAEGNNLLNPRIEISLPSAQKVQTIAQKVAEANGLSLSWDSAIEARSMRDFSFIGTPMQALAEFRREFADFLLVWIAEDGKTLKCAPLAPKTKGAQSMVVLNEKGGMVGAPTPNQYGIVINTLLNPAIKAGAFVRVESSVVSQYNGTYFVMDCKHHGSTQSASWLTTAQLRKV